MPKRLQRLTSMEIKSSMFLPEKQYIHWYTFDGGGLVHGFYPDMTPRYNGEDEYLLEGRGHLINIQNRLKKLGIDVVFAYNAPWVYLESVNGKKVTDTFRADHGFTAFMLSGNNPTSVKFTCRRTVFNKIREVIENG